MDRFGGGCACVDGEDGSAVFTIIAAAIAFASLKVLRWLVLRSQVGWEVGVDDIVLAIFASLLSSRGCIT